MEFSLRALITSCLLMLWGSTAESQRYNFRNYSVANGLGGSTVNNIFQDSKGYLWFGIQGAGVSRFNGKEFKNFTKAEGLVNNDVTFIAEDKKGHIWIAAAGGAAEYDGIKFTNFNGKSGLSDGVIYNIFPDNSGRIWFATKGNGIKIFANNKFDSLTVKDGLTSNEVYCITQDKKGNFWFGLSNGVAKYDGKKITSYSDRPEINGKTFFSVLIDPKGDIWFGTTTGEVYIFHSDMKVERFELPNAVKGSFMGGIAQDKKGAMWFATDFGLLKYASSNFKLFTEKQGLSVNAVQCVHADYEDKIWVGTLSGGVNLLNGETFVGFSDKDGLTSSNITSICAEPKNKYFYLGTSNGLFIFAPMAPNKFKKVAIKGISGNLNISSLSMDKKGWLWITTQSGVLVVSDAGNSLILRKAYRKIGDQEIISPLQTIQDKKGITWLATFGSGLFSINNESVKCYNVKNGFSSDKILTVFEDSRTNIWIGTQDAGVIKYDGKSFHQYSSSQGMTDNTVWSICEDGHRNIYLGTGESGLFRFDGKSFKSYNTNNGICSNSIIALDWDKYNDQLWLGAERGVNKVRFDENGKILDLRTYEEHDGFNSVGINQNAMKTDDSGSVWFGAINGLWFFDRKYDLASGTPPKIQLTGVRLAYQKVDWRNYTDTIDPLTNLPEKLILSYKDNHLVFDIQAMTIDDVSYTFKLDGYDKGWSPLSKTNEISYSNISPGEDYVFRAKAVNSKGIVSRETIPFKFTISPPWWRTWWFRMTSVILAISVILTFIKVRETSLRLRNLNLGKTIDQRTLEITQQKQLVEDRNEKITKQKELVEKTLVEKEVLLGEKVVLLREIHHRVKNNLQTISSMLMLQSASLTNEQSKKVLMESQNRVRSIALIHQKLYQTEGLEKIEFSAFTGDLAEQIKSVYYEQSKKVSIKINMPETNLLIDTAIPLGLILNELLTNSFKYAFNENQSGEIRIELMTTDAQSEQKGKSTITRKSAKLTYGDSGPGLKSQSDLDSASTLGLRLIKLLSQQIGAKLSYSASGGCEFILTFIFSS